ncbi:MAG: FtsH protease activity modulator HflK [Alphaproteobacteria bacterium]|nr:FtsH protease activity modulator HflK [Alphaproteobacteria bacterium]
MPENDNKNPWGRGDRGENGKGPWGSSPGGSGGGGKDVPPDLDEMLRRAQENLRDVMPGGIGGGKVLTLFVLAAATLWLASGFYTVTPEEHAVIQRFGAWERTQTTPGLGYHAPWPIETVSKVNVTTVREMGIGFAAYAGRGTSGTRDVPAESLMLTSDLNIVDIDMVVRWNIKSAEDYLFNIEDPESTIKKVAESAIREVVGQTPMSQIITQERVKVADAAQKILVRNLDEYQSGINISQFLVKNAVVHPHVQEAFQDMQSAKQDAESVQNKAEQYRNDILPKARGQAIKMKQDAEAYKQSTIARATGDAERFNAVYEAYLSGKDVTRERMYIETMEDVLKNAQKIILDENGQGGGVVPYLPLSELKPATGGK